ncbi:MAG TPA: 4-hydroxy-tetrahydrodipicolinate reductase [Caulobacteraceae bacterium]
MIKQHPVRVGIAGASGRMGRLISAAVEAQPQLALTVAFGQPRSAGASAEGRTLGTAVQALRLCDVIIDFSTAQASADLARRAAARGGPALVIGATGFSLDGEGAIRAASERIAIVKSGNYSLGATVLAALVEQAASRLAAGDWDIDIFETHHRKKRDAPSGTALALAEVAARARGLDLADVAANARRGRTAERRAGEIGFSVTRAGEIVGEHAVTFTAEGEILTVSHSARDRRIFARGAVAAALWIADRPPGLYKMRDVLGLEV